MFGGAVVFGVDGQRKRLDRPQVQRRNLFRVRLLALQAAQVQPVGSKYHVHERKDENGGAPSEALVRKVQDLSDAGPNNVVRKGPEIALFPDLLEGLVFHQRDDRRYRKRIGGKIGTGRRGKKQRGAKIESVQQRRVVNSFPE